jgi:cytochrome c peroxidase
MSIRRPLVLPLLGLLTLPALAADPPLGLPPVPVPADNPITEAKVKLGDKLFNDKRFSATGEVSCATCHDRAKGFADALKTSEGIQKLTGTRNGPTVANAAYYTSQFWDGRSRDLEDQSQHPFLNPVEMALPNHEPILQVVRTDPEYVQMFREAFDKAPDAIVMLDVQKAIATFERTLVFGNSPFDRWYFGGEQAAISEAAARGFKVFQEQGRCVSCHMIEQDFALFTDNRFHNIGVGINGIQADIPRLAPAFLAAKARGVDVDKTVLSDKKSSELGRFAISELMDDIGSFKTSTLRNIAVTAPYMHDGSLATLRDVVDHYNNGGVTNKDDPVNDFLSGGIRPLNLTEQQINDLVAFLESLTSPEFAPQQAQKVALNPNACSTPTKTVQAGGAGPLTQTARTTP